MTRRRQAAVVTRRGSYPARVSPRARPSGWERLGLALAAVAGAVVAGLAAALIGMLFASSAYGAVALGFLAGLAGFVIAMPVLAIVLRLGPVFAVAATILVPVGLLGYVDDEVWVPSVGLVSTVLLVLAAWLTDPARRRPEPRSSRRWSGARVGVLLAVSAVVLAIAPPVVSDLRDWRELTADLEALGDPPLAPTAPGAEVRELRGTITGGIDYLVTDPDGRTFVTVDQFRVDTRPVVSDDCFSALRSGPRLAGCTEVAPGIYRAEHRDDDPPRQPVYLLPRDHTVTAVRAYLVGVNEDKYGTEGVGDEGLLLIARSLRPVPVQDLARRDCRVCRLMPD